MGKDIKNRWIDAGEMGSNEYFDCWTKAGEMDGKNAGAVERNEYFDSRKGLAGVNYTLRGGAWSYSDLVKFHGRLGRLLEDISADASLPYVSADSVPANGILRNTRYVIYTAGKDDDISGRRKIQNVSLYSKRATGVERHEISPAELALLQTLDAGSK